MNPWEPKRSPQRSRGRAAEEEPAGPHLDLEVLGRAAPDVCILFTGPASAREIARRVHTLGGGSRLHFRVVDCRWADDVLEREIARGLRPGSSGTVLFEEVGRLSRKMQERLFSALDETPDPRSPRPPRARVMASTSEPLLQRALEGSFHERLLYRLNAIQVVVPLALDDL